MFRQWPPLWDEVKQVVGTESLHDDVEVCLSVDIVQDLDNPWYLTNLFHQDRLPFINTCNAYHSTICRGEPTSSRRLSSVTAACSAATFLIATFLPSLLLTPANTIPNPPRPSKPPNLYSLLRWWVLISLTVVEPATSTDFMLRMFPCVLLWRHWL